jgi:hypothetical protein
LWRSQAVVVFVAVTVALSVAVTDLAGQPWRAVVRAVGVAVTGGGRGGDCNSNGGSGSNG